jgi:hypothetical protein
MTTDDIERKLGTFYDWNWGRAEVIYVLEQLAIAHWEDCGEELVGFAIAMHGLDIAQIADRGGLGEKEGHAAILHNIASITTFALTHVEDEGQRAALEAIYDATREWEWLDCSPYPGLEPRLPNWPDFEVPPRQSP